MQSSFWDIGATPVYSGATPTKATDEKYSYTFASWTPEIVPVTEDAVYMAVFDKVDVLYTIRFENEDGGLIQNTNLAYGSTPSCPAPTKATDAEFSYTFAGWSPAVVPVVGDAVYKATFAKTSYPATEGLGYSLNADGVSYSVSNVYSVTATTVIIPAIYQGLPVTGIGCAAFGGSAVTSVTLPSTLTSIGNRAFATCTALASISIPSSVTSIEGLAFMGCGALTSIVIPDSVTKLGDNVFNDCTALKDVTLSTGITSLQNSAFEGCTSLTSIAIPEGVTSLGDYAFNGCAALTSVSIPDSIARIGLMAFDGCTALTYNTKDGVTYLGNSTHPYLVAAGVASALTSLSLESGCRLVLDGAFDLSEKATLVSGLVNVTLPDSLLGIGDRSFGFLNFASITLPSSLTYMEGEAFCSCSKLTSITVPTGISVLNYNVFLDCSALQSVTLLGAVTSFGETVFGSDAALTSLSYGGTKAQFAAGTKDTTWNKDCSALKSVICSDGTAAL